MAFETADFVAEGNFPLKEKWTKYSKLFPPRRLILYIFHKVWRLLMPKYPLGKVPLKVTSCWGSSLKIQLVVATDHQILIFFFFMAQNTQLFSGKKKFTRQLTNVLIPTNTIFNMFSVHSIFFFSFKYTSTYRTMTICEYTFDD